MSVSHRDNPALNDPPPAHPCQVCKHAVSESWWRMGYDTCSLHSLGVKPVKRNLQEEGDAMARGNATGVSGKLTGKGPQIVQMHDIETRSFASLALAFDCSQVALRNAYKKQKELDAATHEPEPVKTYHREPATKETDVSQLSDALAAHKAGSENPADIIGTEATTPLAGYCIEHGMPAVAGAVCPSEPDGFHCDLGCMFWRPERPEVTLTADEAEALVERIDAVMGEEPTEDRETLWTPEPLTACLSEPTRPVTVYILTPDTVKAPETDPAMAALMRLAEDVPNTQNHLDLITIAHELGQARGRAEL